jgi:S1-C subfamily serine protease
MSNAFEDLSNAMAGAVEKAGKSTLLVDARRRFPASGIAYTADLILTADHVVERDEDIKIILFDGKQISATVAGRDPGSDLALLRLEQAAVTPAEVSKEPARVGQFALALGRPSDEGLQASLGVVSAIGGPVRLQRGGLLERYIRTDTIPYPGFSGGPLVAADGSLLGLNTSGLAHGAALTIPAELAWRTAEMLAKHGHIKRGYLGLRSQSVEIPEAGQKALKREQAMGLLIVGVESGSPAEKGGLMVGDILVGFGDSRVLDHDALFAHLTGDVIGKSVAIEVLRGGKPHTINLTVDEREAVSGEGFTPPFGGHHRHRGSQGRGRR